MDMIEEYEERKRLRRSRFRWRVVAVLALLAVAALVFLRGETAVGPHIARFSVTGIITDDRSQQRILARIAEDDSIEALIVSIDSPGGTVVGSEILYESIREVAEKKPVAAVMRTVAASGGYLAAIAADHIVARGNSITGSVGVIAQMPNAHELLDWIGVDVLEVKSGPLKAQPSPFEPVEPFTVEAKQDMVDESFAWFLGLVEERRTLSPEAVGRIEAGGIFTGRQALEIALIDAIGGEREARKWLEAERGIEEGREIVAYGERGDGLLDRIPGISGILGDRGRPLATGLYAIFR